MIHLMFNTAVVNGSVSGVNLFSPNNYNLGEIQPPKQPIGLA